MVDIEVDVDGETAMHCGGDGLIVSTPIGSTAHNLAAGGPILGQELPAFVITPITPHSLTIRPLVDSADKVYTIRLKQADGAWLVVDGQDLVELTPEQPSHDPAGAGRVPTGQGARAQLLPHAARQAALGQRRRTIAANRPGLVGVPINGRFLTRILRAARCLPSSPRFPAFSRLARACADPGARRPCRGFTPSIRWASGQRLASR